jgi:hypothetical protein
MPERHTHPRESIDETQSGLPQIAEPEGGYHIKHYQNTRHWALA